MKVGPILAQFKGQATFIEKDDVNHKAVLKAEGRDTGGKGNASALITAQLDPHGDDRTKVTVTTDLTITGKVAQFGRGALADVSTKLLNQFVDQLEKTVLTPAHGRRAAPRRPAAAAGEPPATAHGGARRRRAGDGECRPSRKVDAACSSRARRPHRRGRWRRWLKRLAPIGIVGLLVLLIAPAPPAPALTSRPGRPTPSRDHGRPTATPSPACSVARRTARSRWSCATAAAHRS